MVVSAAAAVLVSSLGENSNAESSKIDIRKVERHTSVF